MSLLEVEGLTCGYLQKAVLHELSFNANASESIALLGPNGSGKSTLIRAISRTLQENSRDIAGSIRIGSQDVLGLSYRELAKLVSVVPQEEPQAFAFTVREVVTLGRLARSGGLYDTAEDHASADLAMRVSDCLSLADRPITDLSGGERQRVLIARALAQDTGLLLLDEPTSHLDAPHQLAVAELMQKLAREGRCLITAVHDFNLASRFADRGLLMQDGRIITDGPIESVLESPLLDEVYGVEFERIRSPRGTLTLIPHGCLG